MQGTAWNNGKFLPNGAGWGIQVTNYFRDEFLSVQWPSFFLCLEGEEGEVEDHPTPELHLVSGQSSVGRLLSTLHSSLGGHLSL